MITQQQLKSYQRLLRTYINRSRAEINNLTARTPLNTAEVAQKQHLLTLHANLLNNAEALLAFVDLMLGVESNGRNRHDEMLAAQLDLFHLANAMYDQNGSFLYRTSNGRTVGGGYEGGDYEWAENRISAYDLISILNGNTIPSPTPEQVVKDMTFASAPAQQGPTNTTAQIQQVRKDFAQRFAANPGFREFMEEVLGLGKGALGHSGIFSGRGKTSRDTKKSFQVRSCAEADAANDCRTRIDPPTNEKKCDAVRAGAAKLIDEALEQGRAAAFYWRGM